MKESHPFSFPEGKKGSYRPLTSILEDDKDVDPKHFANEKIVESVKARLKKEPPFPAIFHENKAGNISPLPYSCALRAGASYNYLLVNGKRRLTPRENLRLQGFPEDFPIVLAHSHIRKQCGNSVAIPVIKAVAKALVKAMTAPPLKLNTAPVIIGKSKQLTFA